MHHAYTPKGTCSRLIEFDTDESGRIHNLRFTGGCHGNLQGIAALAEGAQIEELANRLRGIRCGNKQTSCPDQLACALDEAMAN